MGVFVNFRRVGLEKTVATEEQNPKEATKLTKRIDIIYRSLEMEQGFM